MSKYFLHVLLFVMSFAAASPTGAVGSGGGGGASGGSGGGGSSGSGVQVCSEDIWNCSDWSMCSRDGKQRRSCKLFFDCPYIYSIKPDEERACIPPPPPAPTSTIAAPTAPPPTPSVHVTPTPISGQKESERRTVPAACTADIWTCSDWSAACNRFGAHSRVCRLTVDCPESAALAPQETKRCEKLQCGHLPKMRSRILCRLRLAPEGIARELEIQYLPEECRAVSDAAAQKTCITRYAAYRPCWQLPAGEERFHCARTILRLDPGSIKTRKMCISKKGKEKAACIAEMKQKLFSMIKFRMYDLSERAEELLEHEVDAARVADFVFVAEASKQKLNGAKTFARRRQAIDDVRVAWKKLAQRVKIKNAQDNLDQAFKDLEATR